MDDIRAFNKAAAFHVYAELCESLVNIYKLRFLVLYFN